MRRNLGFAFSALVVRTKVKQLGLLVFALALLSTPVLAQRSIGVGSVGMVGAGGALYGLSIVQNSVGGLLGFRGVADTFLVSGGVISSIEFGPSFNFQNFYVSPGLSVITTPSDATLFLLSGVFAVGVQFQNDSDIGGFLDASVQVSFLPSAAGIRVPVRGGVTFRF